MNIVDTLHPENEPNDNLYPNILSENIPNRGVTKEKLADNATSDLVSVKSYHNSNYVVPFTDFDSIIENCSYSWGDSESLANVLNAPDDLNALGDTLFYCYKFEHSSGNTYHIQIIKQFDRTFKRAMSSVNQLWDSWEEIKDGQRIYNCGINDNLPNIINKARLYKNSIVYVQGIHNLTSEMNSYGTGVMLDNNIHIIFSSDAKVTFNYTGSDTSFQQAFSVFNSGYEHDAGYTLENVNIECSNIRYAVHDDLGLNYTRPYTVKFINCNFKIDNSNTSYLTDFHQCIGGGCGAYETVIIDNCIFESVGIESTAYTSDNHAEVSYHNAGLSYGQAKIYVKNSYFTNGGFLITNYGTSTDITTAYVNNCSFRYKAWCNNYSEFTSNVALFEYNNEIRPTLLWENASPTSDFTNQSEILSSSEVSPYKYLIIKYKNHKNNTSSYEQKVEITTVADFSFTLISGFAEEFYSRSLMSVENGLGFTPCYNIDLSVQNQRMIPIAIYGTNK